jgi:shikimate 5-dehydrogenase
MIKMKVAGSPIGHSLLHPLLHNHAYQILGVAAEFTSEEVSELTFPDFYYRCRDSGYSVDCH